MSDLVPIPLDLFDHLADAGLDVDAVLHRAKLPRSRFSGSKPQGTTAQFFALWWAVEERSVDDPSLGIRIGMRSLPDDENVVSLAAMHASTLGEALDKLARYKRLVCPERITIERVDGEARLRFEWLFAEESPPTILTEIIFAGVTNLAEQGTLTRVRPKRLEFTRRSSNEATLKKHFECALRFDVPHDTLVFDEAALALPMARRNEQLQSILVSGLERAVAVDDAERTLADDVRAALSDAICGDRPAVAKVARSLGMSARTMQRRLEELGTTYQDVLDDVRRHLARRLLANTDLVLGEVAFLLGFEEVNSFVRAFNAWEGTPPATWRERHQPRKRAPAR